MIEKRLVQWYAADNGVVLGIAEREIVLTYVLRILADAGLLERLAFKGGTALRKLHMGRAGRFSLDLDFTAVPDPPTWARGASSPDALVLDLAEALHGRTHYGLTFTIPSTDYYATADSCGAEVTYHHDWVDTGRFGLQISFRAPPLLPVHPAQLCPERYFEWMAIDLPMVPVLDLHETIGEKVRAAVQRSRVRDLYDLYQLAHRPFDRALVRRIAVLKCWETLYAFEPEAFLASLPSGRYDWSDLGRLIRRDRQPEPDEVIRGVQEGYKFLAKLTADEADLASDPYGRECRVYRRLIDTLRDF